MIAPQQQRSEDVNRLGLSLRIFIFVLAGVLPAFGGLLAVTAQADPIDDYVALQMRRQHLPGVSLAVVQDGRVVKQQAYGFADLEQKVPVTPDTVFEIGSITKQFVAAALMTLV